MEEVYVHSLTFHKGKEEGYAKARQEMKEYLENLKGIYVKDRDYFYDKGDSVTSNHFDMKIACINLIINELFGGIA